MNSLSTRLWVAWQVICNRAVSVDYRWDATGPRLSVEFMTTAEFEKRYRVR